MHAGSPSKKRHNVWQWFEEEEARTGRTSARHGKKQVYCAECLDADLTLLWERDEQSGNERADQDRYIECE